MCRQTLNLEQRQLVRFRPTGVSFACERLQQLQLAQIG
jgi:hypothetical protein